MKKSEFSRTLQVGSNILVCLFFADRANTEDFVQGSGDQTPAGDVLPAAGHQVGAGRHDQGQQHQPTTGDAPGLTRHLTSGD